MAVSEQLPKDEARALFKRYRLLILLPILLLIGSVAFLGMGYLNTGEWFLRSIELTGGTAITIPANGFGVAELETALEPFSAHVREFIGISGTSLIVTVGPETDMDSVLEALGSLGLPTNLATTESVGSALSEAFWFQAQAGILVAFILMSIAVFTLFRKLGPSVAVILAAASDILVTLALMQVFQIPLSLAGIGALLMLIGYSVDTDILLTSRLTRSGTDRVSERIRSAMKTGLTMTFTTIAVVAVLYFSGISVVISTITAVLLIGLVVDLVNTWIQNVALLVWFLGRSKL